MNYTDAALRTVLAGQSKSSDEVKQTIDNLTSYAPAISQPIEGDVPSKDFEELRQMESEMLEHIQHRVSDGWSPAYRGVQLLALEAGVVGDLPDKLRVGIVGIQALYEKYNEADRLVAAQVNEDSLRGEMKELGGIQQTMASIKDGIKLINRNISEVQFREETGERGGVPGRTGGDARGRAGRGEGNV